MIRKIENPNTANYGCGSAGRWLNHWPTAPRQMLERENVARRTIYRGLPVEEGFKEFIDRKGRKHQSSR